MFLILVRLFLANQMSIARSKDDKISVAELYSISSQKVSSLFSDEQIGWGKVSAIVLTVLLSIYMPKETPLLD